MDWFKVHDLYMSVESTEEGYILDITVCMGQVDFPALVKIDERDVVVLKNNRERAVFLNAAMEIRLANAMLGKSFVVYDAILRKSNKFIYNNFFEKEQRDYLDIILHGAKTEVEAFLTKVDSCLNGAVSHHVRLTTGRNISELREGFWFER